MLLTWRKIEENNFAHLVALTSSRQVDLKTKTNFFMSSIRGKSTMRHVQGITFGGCWICLLFSPMHHTIYWVHFCMLQHKNAHSLKKYLRKSYPSPNIHQKRHLKSSRVQILNGRKGVGLQMVWISNGIWNPEAEPFEIQTNGTNFVKNHL